MRMIDAKRLRLSKNEIRLLRQKAFSRSKESCGISKKIFFSFIFCAININISFFCLIKNFCYCIFNFITTYNKSSTGRFLRFLCAWSIVLFAHAHYLPSRRFEYFFVPNTPHPLGTMLANIYSLLALN